MTSGNRERRRGRWPAKHTAGLDPGLVGVKAYQHPAVREWWSWLLNGYQPRASVAVVMPCSNVKPYTRSPASRKMRGLLRRLGLWDNDGDRPSGVEWLYFSDLLILVPYERVEEYPACCYEVHPDQVLGNPEIRSIVTGLLAETMGSLAAKGLHSLVVFLPKKHLMLWDEARERAGRWPEEKRVRYTLFSFKPLGDALLHLLHG